MILADKRDYKHGYQKHYSAYIKLYNNNTSVISRHLLLVYCVECGLKYLLLDKWHENNPKKIFDNKEDKRIEIIGSHNLEKILKELGQLGSFKFPQLKSKHQDNITSDNYHQLCRYGIKIRDGDREKTEKYEEVLRKIAIWIEEGM